jgi:nicotinamidase-related amidase
MKNRFRLHSDKAALVVVDVQEKLFPLIDRPCEVMERLKVLIQGAALLEVPIIATEQYPKGLGGTIAPLKDLIGSQGSYPAKTTFSACAEASSLQAITQTGKTQWIVAGIEAHVCVLQTVRDLLDKGFNVVVVNDAISSRSVYDFSTAIAEMRDMGARIASTETVLFELVHDAKHPKFKAFSQLIK